MKLKTKKSAYKRINKKKSCMNRRKAYKSHLLRRKNSKRLRTLSSPSQIHPADSYSFSVMIPY